MTRRPRRRTLVLGGVTGVAGLGVGTWQLHSSFDGCDDAVAIGARFASAYTQKSEALWQGRGGPGDAHWRAYVREQRRKDLEAGNLVEVDGWWLAETELLVCVLMHRARSDPARFGSPLPC